MNTLLEPLIGLLRFFVGWVAPLGILTVMFLFGLRLFYATRSATARVAGRAGMLVGLATCVLVIYRFPPMTVAAVNTIPTSSMLVFLSLAAPAVLLGAGFMILVEHWAHTSAVGVLICVLTAASTTAAYSYVFGSTSRDALFTASLFLLIGAGLRVLLAPRRIAETMGNVEREPGHGG